MRQDVIVWVAMIFDGELTQVWYSLKARIFFGIRDWILPSLFKRSLMFDNKQFF